MEVEESPVSQGGVTPEETGNQGEVVSKDMQSQADLCHVETGSQGEAISKEMDCQVFNVSSEETESQGKMTPEETGSQEGVIPEEAGKSQSEIGQMATKLHELQKMCKVDIVKQFENFLRNVDEQRNSDGEGDFSQRGEKNILIGEGKGDEGSVKQDTIGNETLKEFEHGDCSGKRDTCVAEGNESVIFPLESEYQESGDCDQEGEKFSSRKRQGLPELRENVPAVKSQKCEKTQEGVKKVEDRELAVSGNEKGQEYMSLETEHLGMDQSAVYCQKTEIEAASELHVQQDEGSHVAMDTKASEVIVEEGGAETVTADSSQMAEAFPYTFSEKPQLLATAKEDFSKGNNFLKGCKWSPDGTCILTNSEDGTLRLFNLPGELYSPSTWEPVADMKSVLNMVEGELVYDYCWYPRMTSLQPETCCFVSTCRSHPVHMWDAFDGQLRCSYRPHDHLDELITPHSLAFSLDGSRLYCGFNKLIKTFDITRPGKDCETRQTKGKLGGQTGIISCFAMHPDGDMFAAGSYSKTIGLYSPSCPSAICVLHGQASGITQLKYSSDGSKLYSGGRKDNQILCWDVRKLNEVLFYMNRNVTTNQRMYFDIDRENKFLVSGNQNGRVSVWDLNFELSSLSNHPHPLLDTLTQFSAHEDATNGVSLHPSLPLLATASGQRKVGPPVVGSDGESDEELNQEDEQKGTYHNSLRIWSLYENR